MIMRIFEFYLEILRGITWEMSGKPKGQFKKAPLLYRYISESGRHNEEEYYLQIISIHLKSTAKQLKLTVPNTHQWTQWTLYLSVQCSLKNLQLIQNSVKTELERKSLRKEPAQFKRKILCVVPFLIYSSESGKGVIRV